MKIEMPEARQRLNDPERRIQKDDLTDSVPYLLQLAARLQTTDFMSSLAETKVHPAEAFVIHELRKSSPLSQTELSTRLDVGNAAIGKTLTRLQSAGFITRSRHPSDSRRVMARLTDKGIAVHQEFYRASDALIEQIVDLLGAAEERRLHQALTVLVEKYRERIMSRRASTALADS